jgi:8-oxo-dGTP diphosphatase
MSLTKYVVGLYFDNDWVLLIRKERPAWQKGMYNGVGGHIEPGEKPVEAMRREFREEAGIDIGEERWQNFSIYRGKDWKIHFYCADRNIEQDVDCKTMTDEEVRYFNIARLPTVIPNLHWLIPLAHIDHRQPQDWPFIIIEKGG